MQIEKLTHSEIEKIRNLQPDGWSDITGAFQFYTNNDYCNPIKVLIDNKIVGIGNSILFDNSAWLSHIIVDKDYRNCGIGLGIVDFLLKDIKTKNIETSLLIATELGEPVYVKAGFRKVSDYRFFKKEGTLEGKEFSDKIEPFRDDFYKEIIRLDTYISGENREKLLKTYIDEAFVFIENEMITGYYIPGLGEGPIFAITEEAARELMRLKYSTTDKATIPGENQTGIEIMHQLGFVETGIKGKRMIFGKDIAWKPEMIYSRIGGNLG
jgi:hypothetical protein